jgi:hypothetical protein
MNTPPYPINPTLTLNSTMVPIRRPRNSIPTSPNPNPSDEFANLTLAEVRDRLTRNARVLSSTLLTPSTSPSSASVLNQHMAGPSRPRIPHDPVRAKLETVREGLLAREAELLAGEMGAMSVDVKEEPMEMKVELGSSPLSPTTSMGRRGSGTPGGSRSGKQRALDLIRQGESDLPPGAILLYVPFSSPPYQISVEMMTDNKTNRTNTRTRKQRLYNPNSRFLHPPISSEKERKDLRPPR